MVFAPIRRADDVSTYDPDVRPRTVERLQPEISRAPRRVFWRAVVHAADRGMVQTAWHLAECTVTGESSAHCPVGQELVEKSGDPDGHCMIDGECRRCAGVAGGVRDSRLET
jgi:hypothetical protein